VPRFPRAENRSLAPGAARGVRASSRVGPEDGFRYDGQAPCANEPLRRDLAQRHSVKTTEKRSRWSMCKPWAARVASAMGCGPSSLFSPVALAHARDINILLR